MSYILKPILILLLWLLTLLAYVIYFLFFLIFSFKIKSYADYTLQYRKGICDNTPLETLERYWWDF